MMKLFRGVFLSCIFLSNAVAQPDEWGAVQQSVHAWHEKNAPAVKMAAPMLRVVYFHGNDMEPLENYQERLDRVMDDISDFYRDGMKALGFESDGLKLEKGIDNKLVIHVVKAEHNAVHYDYKSGSEAEKEMRKALAGKIDFDREFVLALYGQCWKMDDGRYGFYSPYHGKGGSNQRWGFCHAADCHLLDPKLLTDTKNRFKYWEHYGDRDQTVAKFNSFYIGGIAHELGHGLGLPHDGETQVQRFLKGRSLMGNGNLTYREELWRPKSKGSFLSLASGVRLVSHPLFTGSHAGRFDSAKGFFTGLAAKDKGDDVLEISGKVKSEIPSYAVIAYVDPAGGGDYDAKTFVTLPNKEDGTFTLENVIVPKQETQIRLVACFVNGETEVLKRDVERGGRERAIKTGLLFAERSLIPEAERAVAAGSDSASDLVERAERQLKPDDAEGRQQIDLLKKWLKPAPDLVELSKVKGNAVFLSDAKWEKAESGWAGTPRDRWGAEPKFGQGLFLNIAGKLHAKGLPAHCPAQHLFASDGKWDRFNAIVGLRDGAQDSARAIFIIMGDGKELHRSKQLSPSKTEKIDIDISGVKQLQLLTKSGMDRNHTCWAVWGSAKVTRVER